MAVVDIKQCNAKSLNWKLVFDIIKIVWLNGSDNQVRFLAQTVSQSSNYFIDLGFYIEVGILDQKPYNKAIRRILCFNYKSIL